MLVIMLGYAESASGQGQGRRLGTLWLPPSLYKKGGTAPPPGGRVPALGCPFLWNVPRHRDYPCFLGQVLLSSAPRIQRSLPDISPQLTQPHGVGAAVSFIYN